MDLQGNGFSQISLALRQGEIVGFTGLQGSGCSQVLQSIFGAGKMESGKNLTHAFIASAKLHKSRGN